MRGRWWEVAALTLIALVIGLAFLALGLRVAGFDPGPALAALWSGAFGSWYAFTSATALRSVPLIFLGLAFAIAARGGALNIGGEGQFCVGAIAATVIGTHVHGWPAALAIPAVLLGSMAGGVLWILVPVVLKVRFGVLEVISTLLLNFVAEQFVSLMVQGPLQEARHTYPQSDPLLQSARLPVLPGTRLHIGFLLAASAGAVCWWVFSRTLWGFRLRAVGLSPRAAQVSGRINVPRIVVGALLWSGVLAGLSGGVEVSGVTYALFQNLSPGYGFTAIAVALLARLQPGAIVVTGLLFGALEAGAGAMQRDAGIPAVSVYVVEAVIILVVLLADVLARRYWLMRVVPVEESVA